MRQRRQAAASRAKDRREVEKESMRLRYKLSRQRSEHRRVFQ